MRACADLRDTRETAELLGRLKFWLPVQNRFVSNENLLDTIWLNEIRISQP